MKGEKRAMTREEAQWVYEVLEETFPDARAELDFNTPYQLLIATILSAQCTDVRVNQITEVLFEKYPDPYAMAEASQEEIEEIIRSCGFFRNKAKNVLGASRVIVEEYGGEIPQTVKELMTLPGVGKKTANVVASNVLGIDAIAVDTHVYRTANRLGLADSASIQKTEEELMAIWPRAYWSKGHHLLIFLGRRICHSQNPDCQHCPLAEGCHFNLGLVPDRKASQAK
ncbi:MAG: endonuclease III [Tissierellia bacterium]|nr:endonuclease III [Tissierellia bacterium]